MAHQAPHPSPDVPDHDPDFCRTVSLLAALEGAVGLAGHHEALPYLGMARAELVDFGQRQPGYLIDVVVPTMSSGLQDLDELLSAGLRESEVLQHSLRIDAARRQLRRIPRLHG